MRDLLSTYEEQGELSAVDLQENPFIDQAAPTLIGEGYYILEPLGYLMDNPINICLTGTTYQVHGSLNVNIIPVDPDGNPELNMDLLPEEPEDLLHSRIDFLVNIISAENLPADFCRDVFVEYQLYLGEEKFRTEKVEGKERNPEFNYAR